jgi:hypothetical protein
MGVMQPARHWRLGDDGQSGPQLFQQPNGGTANCLPAVPACVAVRRRQYMPDGTLVNAATVENAERAVMQGGHKSTARQCGGKRTRM